MSIKSTFICHQGYTDLINCIGLINYYSKFNDELLIFVYDNPRLVLLKYLLKDNKKIKITIPKLSIDKKNNESCIICHTENNCSYCPRCPTTNCHYIDYSKYLDYQHIKIGCFNNYFKWDFFMNNNKFSFAHCFYLYNGVLYENRINNFFIYRDIKNEKQKYDQLIGKIGYNYIVVNGCADKINTDYKIYDLTNVSEILVDQLEIIKNAKEVHLIDSVYSVLLYLLFKKYNYTTEGNIHIYFRQNRHRKFYENPLIDNNKWIFH